MGWFGYNIYDGDDTQTQHLDFCKWAKLYKSDNDLSWQDEHLTECGTKLNKEEKKLFLENIDLVLKKMPKRKYYSEDDHMMWHMLLALFVDNKMKPPKIVKQKGTEAVQYLMGDHASDFCEPSRRRSCLRRFLEKVEKL